MLNKDTTWFSSNEILIPDLIRQNSHWLANKPALIFSDNILTWKQLGDKTNKISNALMDLGLHKGDAVVVLMRNSSEMMESILGIISAGLVVVPLNVSINDEAIINMIENCSAKSIIASHEYVDKIESLRGQLNKQIENRFIGLKNKKSNWFNFDEIVSTASSSSPNVELKADDICNIIYSSGTTGLPKGIVHTHSCRYEWASNMSNSLRYDSSTKCLFTLGLYSNISWVAMLNTIITGGTMYVSERFDVVDCFTQIQKHKITHFAMVPVQFQLLLNNQEFKNYDLSSIKATMCCGSPLSVQIKHELQEKLPGDFIELYGLTEGLVTILSPEDMSNKINSVGRPFPGQELRIIGNDNKVLKNGEAGEIVGVSKILMSGYLNNENANKLATWSDRDGTRWFRTGDIGKLDDDGFLYLIDRKKDMIISGGQNIYPADIEATLSCRVDLKEWAVIGVESKKWGETPIAIVVANGSVHLDCEEIKRWLNSSLGKQQKVAMVIKRANLPRNPAGKVLKRELRKEYANLGL